MKMTSVGLRWAFNVSGWRPSSQQWIYAAQCIQPEEQERIGKFVFQKDCKSAMIGRLLLRKAASECLGMPYNDICFARTDKGKPYITNSHSHMPGFNVNISHQGDYAVLVADACHDVGVDIMKVEYPSGNRDVENFLQTFRKQFTSREWDTITDPGDDWARLELFYRHWASECLKESYVKALGTGLSFSVNRLAFDINSALSEKSYISDTSVFVDEQKDNMWKFEETLLERRHCVSVALKKHEGFVLPEQTMPFQELHFEQLVENAKATTTCDESYWNNFEAKDEKPKKIS